ncbi:MAG TPA: hypothetical protein VF010_14155 [Methylomirabilota bacterium]|jgi:hypothetical protein|nr:hypothetical protein [Methylomirabilota bacterium]
MKKMMTTLSFILAVALALGPWAATLAEARGGGGPSGGGGAPSGGGAPAGAAPSASPGDDGPTSTSSSSGSPSSSTGVGNPSTSLWGAMPAASPRLTSSEPRTVTGEVLHIDRTTGMFSLKTQQAGTLRLQTAPSALAGVREGDQMTVQIGVTPTR